MQYAPFGHTGMTVSRLCLGAMTFGQELDADEAGRVIDEAIDHGVNLIDTADSYGESEAVIGRHLTPAKREKVFLATKVFRRPRRDGRIGRNSPTNIRGQLEASLKKLDTDYVDLYQLHHPDPETPVQETLRTLDALVEEGKIRHVGCSNHYAWQIAETNGVANRHDYSPVVSLQACYSIIDRPIENETVPLLERHGLGLMVYSPLGGGILTGKYTGRDEPPEGSRAEKNRNLQERLEDPAVHEIVEGLEPIADEHDVALHQLAFLWLLAKPYVTTAIIGGSRPGHFSDAWAIADRSLDDEVVERINELSESCRYRPFRNQPMREGPDDWEG